MLWKFVESSAIDTLLTKQDITLREILNEDDVLQECKNQNVKLIEFITREDVIKELVGLVVSEPSDEDDDSCKYKYMNLACEVIKLDINIILDTIVNEEALMETMWNFMHSPCPLNPLLASFFSKVFALLVNRKTTETLNFLKSHDAVNKLIVHIEISAIMELFIKMITESPARLEYSKWLDEEELIPTLTKLMHPSQNEETHYNAAQLLSELVRIGRDAVAFSEEEDPLLNTLEKQETIELLLSMMFNDLDAKNADSSVVNGITILSSMLEVKTAEGRMMEEPIVYEDRVTQGVYTTLHVLSSWMPKFHDLLTKDNSTSTMETTFGTLNPPLGKVRLNIAALIATTVSANNTLLNEALVKTGTVDTLLDLFAYYQWNNFLHTYVQQCISAILSSEELPVENDEEENQEQSTENTLLKYMFKESCLIDRCIRLWENNEISIGANGARKGYMGHLTKIINEITNAQERGPNSEFIKSMFNELSDETRNEWNEMVTGPLAELNKKNLSLKMPNLVSAFETDSDSEEYKSPHGFKLYEVESSMQQAFENYQVKPMTHGFIETFGYDENEINESEDQKNPFEKVGNIDFGIKANEQSESEKLFESICAQNIQPFDDNEDANDDEEDIWEEKQLSFSTPHNRRNIRSREGNTVDSSSSEEDESEDTSKDEKMDVDGSEAPPQSWTANFDNMDFQENAWSNAAQQNTSTSSEQDFADFTNIAQTEISDNPVIAPMDTEHQKPAAASAYEVKMDEDDEHTIHTGDAGDTPSPVDTPSIPPETPIETPCTDQNQSSTNSPSEIDPPLKNNDIPSSADTPSEVTPSSADTPSGDAPPLGDATPVTPPAGIKTQMVGGYVVVDQVPEKKQEERNKWEEMEKPIETPSTGTLHTTQAIVTKELKDVIDPTAADTPVNKAEPASEKVVLSDKEVAINGTTIDEHT